MCGEDERSIYMDNEKWRRLVTGNIANSLALFFFFGLILKPKRKDVNKFIFLMFLSLSPLDLFPLNHFVLKLRFTFHSFCFST